jgi:hypothetical protein
VSLMMLTSMNILFQRDVPDLNFELVYAEYDRHVQGLGAADETLTRFVYSKGSDLSIIVCRLFSAVVIQSCLSVCLPVCVFVCLFDFLACLRYSFLAICLKAFQTLHTLGIIECNASNEKRPFASQIMVCFLNSYFTRCFSLLESCCHAFSGVRDFESAKLSDMDGVLVQNHLTQILYSPCCGDTHFSCIYLNEPG